MTTQEASLNFLRCPDAIPNRVSIRDQALWGDSIGAIWPDGEPTPLTREQDEALGDLLTLKDAGIFTPVWLEDADLEFAASGLKQVAPPEKIQGDGSTWASACGPLMAAASTDTATPLLPEDEAMRFLRHGKLTEKVELQLLAEGLVERIGPEDDFFHGHLRAKSVELIPWLLTKAAEARQAQEPDYWTLAPSNPQAVGQVACPKRRARQDLALALELPALPAVRDDVPIEELIELRADKNFQQARFDYVAHLGQVRDTLKELQEESVADPSNASLLKDFEGRLQEEVRAATRPLWQRSTLANSMAAGAGVAQVIVAGATAVISPSALAAISASLGALEIAGSFITPILARRNTPKFLRMSRSVLVRPPEL